MPYSKFESIEEVAERFDIEVKIVPFIQQSEIQIPGTPFSRLQVKLADSAYFINEYAICEHIIAPVLDLVVEHYEQLRVWSHAPFNVDKEKDLIGEPDYLIAPKTKYGGMSVPPLCVIEAKKEKFDEGWAQALAEMVAASFQGSSMSFGVVTTGKIWEFGKLKDKLFTKDPDQVSATRELQTLFDMLNWLFNEANESITHSEQIGT
ncbi:MAG: hypothetical protein HQK75_12155 [Candidatus Magnetomorum sp.]|nr:hypothetical protein [Candidatus Magnetomorum sp.]